MCSPGSSAHVVVLDLDEAAARRTADGHRAAGGQADAIVCDVADADQVAARVRRIVAEHRRVDILVNNAGIAHVGTIETTTEADLDRLFA